MTYTLIDGNNWLRRKFEEDRSISGLRASLNSLRSEIARPNNQVIFFWDGFNGNAYRRGIFPGYKQRPNLPGQDEFHLQANLFRKIVENLPIPYFRMDGWEADDLIAAFALALPKGTKIHIKSTDKDFEQIVGATHEGRTLTDTLQDIVAKAAEANKPIVGADPVITSEFVVPYKVMVGDKSDSIPGIPGFGEKRWLLSNKQEILDWFASDFDQSFVPEMSQKLQMWCFENTDTLRAMRDICLFRPIDTDTLASHMRQGVDNPTAIEQILKENLA